MIDPNDTLYQKAHKEILAERNRDPDWPIYPSKGRTESYLDYDREVGEYWFEKLVRERMARLKSEGKALG